MKLYTRQGDSGRTQLGDRTTVDKDHARVAAYGEVDELNAALGLAAAACDDDTLTKRFGCVQNRLFVLGAELSNPSGGGRSTGIGSDVVAEVEGWIDEACAQVSPLKSFILPGGCELAARLHLARTVCRRAERSVVALAKGERIGAGAVVFLNRLSDLLFAWARLANHRRSLDDVPWHLEGESGSKDS